jgi:hypothetical protein
MPCSPWRMSRRCRPQGPDLGALPSSTGNPPGRKPRPVQRRSGTGRTGLRPDRPPLPRHRDPRRPGRHQRRRLLPNDARHAIGTVYDLRLWRESVVAGPISDGSPRRRQLPGPGPRFTQRVCGVLTPIPGSSPCVEFFHGLVGLALLHEAHYGTHHRLASASCRLPSTVKPTRSCRCLAWRAHGTSSRWPRGKRAGHLHPPAACGISPKPPTAGNSPSIAAGARCSYDVKHYGGLDLPGEP